MDANEQNETVNWGSGRVMLGVLLISVGALMMLDRLGMLDFRLSGHYWPLFLIVFGFARFLSPFSHRGVRRSRRGGAWMILIGVWGLVNELHLFGLSYDNSWPLMIVFAGVMMIWRAIEGPQPRRVREN